MSTVMTPRPAVRPRVYPVRRPGGHEPTASHLLWLPAGAFAGFLASFVLADLLAIPVDAYYALHAAIVLGFLAFYARRTRLDLRAFATRRLRLAIPLGLAGGLVLARGVLAQPETAHLSGALLGWALAWRGLVYGAVDGLLLFAFPFVVVWRALGGEHAGRGGRLRALAMAWAASLVITTTYHLGYADFRSAKIVQPNIGSAIGALPTLIAASPIASPISHVFLHVTAVLHSPHTDLFLPPHRE